jgi:hypothetical protein
VANKSGQADIVVVELPGTDARRALETGHWIADALTANSNTSLKRLIVMTNGKLVLDRALGASGRALLRIQERVQQKLADPREARRREGQGTERREVRAGDPRAPVLEPPSTEGVRDALGRQESRANAVEGAALMILAAQFNSLQDAEKRKIYKRLSELAPRIQELQKQGLVVNVWGQAEVPDQIDILGGVTGARDVGQVVYFVDLWLAASPPTKARSPNPQTTMSGDPSAPAGGDRAYRHAIDRFPRPGYHFQVGLFMTFQP